MTVKKKRKVAEVQEELNGLLRRHDHCAMWYGLRLGIMAETKSVGRKIERLLDKYSDEMTLNTDCQAHRCGCFDCRKARGEAA